MNLRQLQSLAIDHINTLAAIDSMLADGMTIREAVELRARVTAVQRAYHKLVNVANDLDRTIERRKIYARS